MSGRTDWLHTRDESSVPLQLFRHHVRVDGNGCVEVCEYYYEDSEDEVVPESGVVTQSSSKSTGCIPTGEEHREQHQRLGEDDRHHAGCVDFERDVLTYTTVLLVSDNPLRILYRNPADSLHNRDGRNDNEEPEYQFDDDE